MKVIDIILGVILVALSTSCSNMKKSDGQEAEGHEETHTEEVELTQEQMNTVGIKVGPLEERNLRNVLRVNGTLKVVPQDRAEVSSLVSGVVQRILVTEGSRVTKGQVVAWIENTEVVAMQKNYLTAVRQCQAAYMDYQRQKGLAHYGAGVKKTLQQAESTYEIAKVERDGLAKQLRQLSVSPSLVAKGRITTQIPVYAPISGVVNSVAASTGSYADMQKPLMQITNTAGIYGEMKVYEKDIYTVKSGQAVDLMLTNHPAMRLHGVVTKINQTFDPQTKAVSVFVRLQDKGHKLLIPDMSVSGLIDTGRTATQAVPNDAVVLIENVPYIFMLENTAMEKGRKTFHFKKIKVVTGASELGYTQITPVESLPKGAQVVTSNAFYLSSMISEHGEHAH